MTPHDPLFLELEYWEMELDYEIDEQIDKEQDNLLNNCPQCGSVIYGNYCEKCKKNVPTEKYFDPDWETYASAVEAEGDELDKELKNPENWVEVSDKEDA